MSEVRKDTVCRIVDAPWGVYHPPAESINKLVRAIVLSSLPSCCPGHMISFTLMELSDGPIWEVEALQHIKNSQGHIAPPGAILVLPKKNLAPLPDVKDEDEITFTKELEHV